MNPQDLLYSESHEWVRRGAVVTIGITDFAQDQLGDVVFVEVPEVGTSLKKGETFGSVESVKTVSDLYAPLSGTIVEVNQRLVDQPELVNTSPYDDGWLLKVEPDPGEDFANLVDSATYEATSAH